MSLPDPVIVIPGITANCLVDDYALDPQVIWSVLNRDYVRASLHPDDTRYEASEPALVRPGSLFDVAYKELIEELRHNLSETPVEPVPVFPFSYDWRQPLEASEELLRRFVVEAIERTCLLKHYVSDGYAARRTVSVVAHSMGGLVLTGYLQRHGIDSRISKVVTLATPFKGSFEAVLKITTGTATIGTTPPSSREREAARLTPALYYLTPRVAVGVEVDPGAPADLFDPASWQPSITETIAQYIKLHGTDQRDPDGQARRLFEKLLESARAHRDRIEGLKLRDCGLAASDWLCVVGVNSKTRVRLHVTFEDGLPDFDLSRGRENQWETSPDPTQRIFTGDGTVPFEGALPSFLDLSNLVCVTPDDYGYWEIGDRVVTQVAGFHGILPNMDMLHRLIVRHFANRADPHKNTWGRAAPGVSHWEPPLPLTQKQIGDDDVERKSG